jgi:hypothetical protein
MIYFSHASLRACFLAYHGEMFYNNLCMHEELSSHAEQAPVIELPSRLRLHQRLGQLSLEGSLTDRIERLGGQTLAAEQLVDRLEGVMSQYADEHTYGIQTLVLRDMPKVLNKIIEEPEAKARALDIWGEKVEARQVAAEKVNEVKRRYTKKQKVPRKIKKARQRDGKIAIDPARLHRG